MKSAAIALVLAAVPAVALAQPQPVDEFALPAPADGVAFSTSFDFGPNGAVYAYDGLNVFGRVGGFFEQINDAPLNVAGSDAGPITVAGDTIYVGTGFGGRDFSGDSSGLTFSLPIDGGDFAAVPGRTAFQFDFAAVPGAGDVLAVNRGNATFDGSSVDFYDAGDGSLTPFVTDIPGASTAVGFGDFRGQTSLFAGVGFGERAGEVRAFDLGGGTVDFDAGDLVLPAGSGVSGTGFFVSDAGLFFAGQGIGGGVTVVTPGGETFDFGGLSDGFNAIAYDAATDRFASESGGVVRIFEASDFAAAIPEPAGATALVGGAVLGLLRRRRRLAAAAVVVAAPATASADAVFASEVIDVDRGSPTQSGFDDPALALGEPRGGGESVGSFDVFNLGVGGSITLGFGDFLLKNGPGDDLAVFENAVYLAGSDPLRSFAELLFVEVSSDGETFARFPTASLTPEPVGPFGTIAVDDVGGFAGVTPTLADGAGGDRFDFAALAGESVVLSGAVNLDAVRFVRLIDLVGDGTAFDSEGRAIFDAFGSGNGGADVDAVAGLNAAIVPEPAVLAFVGAAGLLLRRRVS